ncbi:MAG TPA: carboxypeptidase-like regulatory domain-containing protein [Terriglobales bacterium]|nr:carboxypeptidase-like regulatory domain-containing protein [Terriglobales bacterium]
MNRKLIAFAVALSLFMAVIPFVAAENSPATRTLQGQVMKGSEVPLPGAVVYLKNTKTMAVRSFISDNSGNYRFTSLSPNVDYEVFAEYKGAKSDTKTLSAFDSRATATINLKVNAQ